jgi:hypothetical protein
MSGLTSMRAHAPIIMICIYQVLMEINSLYISCFVSLALNRLRHVTEFVRQVLPRFSTEIKMICKSSWLPSIGPKFDNDEGQFKCRAPPQFHSFQTPIYNTTKRNGRGQSYPDK